MVAVVRGGVARSTDERFFLRVCWCGVRCREVMWEKKEELVGLRRLEGMRDGAGVELGWGVGASPKMKNLMKAERTMMTES